MRGAKGIGLLRFSPGEILALIFGESFGAIKAFVEFPVEVASLEAENGAVWITEELMGHRALPFITQHLAIVINANDIVPTMHQAYKRIGDARQGFGTFIAGPSKTADIEQSLVIGAHGSRSMTVFLLGH